MREMEDAEGEVDVFMVSGSARKGRLWERGSLEAGTMSLPIGEGLRGACPPMTSPAATSAISCRVVRGTLSELTGRRGLV